MERHFSPKYFFMDTHTYLRLTILIEKKPYLFKTNHNYLRLAIIIYDEL